MHREAAGHASRTHPMVSQVQHNQMGAPVSHWQAVICCESSPSRSPLPSVPHPIGYVCYQDTPSHSSHYRCAGRHSLVVLLFAILEWHSQVSSPHTDCCRRHGAFHQCRCMAPGVGYTSRVHGSTTHGNHTKPSTPSSGRNYLPSLQQHSLGATSGMASGSGSTVTTRP